MSRQLFEEARKVLTQEAAVKLDPVGREDNDIDNDGVANNTDSYLKKRRGAISAAIAKSKNESSLSDDDVEKLKSILGEQGVDEGATMPKQDPGYILDRLDPRHPANRGMGRPLKVNIQQRLGRDVYGQGRQAAGMPAIHHYATKPRLPGPVAGVAEGRLDEIGDTPAGKAALRSYISKSDADVERLYPQISSGLGKPTAVDRKIRKRISGGISATNRLIGAGINRRRSSIYDRPSVTEGNEKGVAEEAKQIQEISDKREFKRNELEHELGHEDRAMASRTMAQPHAVQINGKKWKTFGSRSHAENVAKKIKGATVYKEEIEQVDEQGRVIMGRRYGNQNLNAPATGRIAADNARTAPQATVTTTSLMPGHSDSGARLLAVQAPGLPGNRRVNLLDRKPKATKSESFEMIENMSYGVPENPSYQDYIKAALSIAECKSFSELSEEDQQYIIQEMEDAFRSNDIDFILEANAVVDMKADIAFLESNGYVVEGCYDDDQLFYVYEDKDTKVIRKVFYEGTQKITQVL